MDLNTAHKIAKEIDHLDAINEDNERDRTMLSRYEIQTMARMLKGYATMVESLRASFAKNEAPHAHERAIQWGTEYNIAERLIVKLEQSKNEFIERAF